MFLQWKKVGNLSNPFPLLAFIAALAALILSVNTRLKVDLTYERIIHALILLNDTAIEQRDKHFELENRLQSEEDFTRRFKYAINEVLVETKAHYGLKTETLVNQMNRIQAVLFLALGEIR
jgi:hypothetical protein